MCLNFVDTKNSVGLVGCIEEVAHNAIAVYWNPLESTAKVSTKYMYLQFLFYGIFSAPGIT
jgi:hypothetical protein